MTPDRDPTSDRDRSSGRSSERSSGRSSGRDDEVRTFKNEEDASPVRLFDLRWLIGGLFTFYGLVLVVSSFWIDTAKSNGIDINLWLGLGMLALGVFFLVWARLRPLVLEGESAASRRDHA